MSVRRIDHLVFAVRDLAQAAEAWARVLGLRAEASYRPAGAHLDLARLMLEADGAFLELAQPATADHRLARFIEERGEGMFSISLQVDDLDAAVAEFRGKGLDVSAPEPGPWPGTRLARIPRAKAHGVAVQLIERAPAR